MPDLLHVVPVGHDAVLDGVLQGEDSSLALSFISYIGVLLSHAHHDSLMTGTSHDGGEHSSGSDVSGAPGLAHARPIVHDQSLHLVFTDLVFVLCTCDLFKL